MLSRRSFVISGIGAVAAALAGGFAGVEKGVLPGRIRLARLMGECDVDAAAPRVATPVESGSFASSARKATVGWALATPDHAGDKMPVALVLHGRGGNHMSAFSELRLQNFLAAYVESGGSPFALAAIDGGDDTYWHPRRDGDNPIAMLTEEFLPMLRERGLDTRRVGVLGWSMGGYGALLLARESHRGHLGDPHAGPVRVVAAAAGSPALFNSYETSADGAFDNAADFAKYGTLANNPDVGDVALYVSCGHDDAFTETTKNYRANVSPTPAGGIRKGCHTDGFWRSIAAEQIAFLGTHLG